MSDKLIVIIQLVFLAIFIATLIYVSHTGKATLTVKLILTLSSIGVLCFDKIKLLIWALAVGAIWLFRYSKKENKTNGNRNTIF